MEFVCLFYMAYCHPIYLTYFSLLLVTLKKYKMHIDRNTGIIEMFMEKLQDEDEGTYTFQVQDGRATGHSTLVLIGDGKCSVKHYLEDFATPFNANTPSHESDHVGGSKNYFLIRFQCSKCNLQLILSIVFHFIELKVDLKGHQSYHWPTGNTALKLSHI